MTTHDLQVLLLTEKRMLVRPRRHSVRAQTHNRMVRQLLKKIGQKRTLSERERWLLENPAISMVDVGLHRQLQKNLLDSLLG